MSRNNPNNIYSIKSRWKIYLGLAGLLIVLLSLVYTYYLSNKIKEEEKHKVQHIALAIQALQDSMYLTLVNGVMHDNSTTPLILVNDRGGIDGASNFGERQDQDTVFLRKELNQIIQNGGKPFVVSNQYNTQYIYYKQSKLLTQLNYMPLIQLLLISAFIFLGYMAFSAARQTEQNLVWVGMAKETAHQLGTPITAIVAWIEHLKMLNPDDEMTQNIVNELQKDVTRLELIAERFSKVGSTPDLVPTNINEELEKVMEYMRARSPKKMKFSLTAEKDKIIGDINAPLFDWVIENLIRNALDAMEGKGSIHIDLKTTNNRIIIHLSDTGKGIPSGKLKTIFNPGYTTKKRGWGLGLSLSKRIIESYHSGKIFVKSSSIGKGTTFEIDLPLNSAL